MNTLFVPRTTALNASDALLFYSLPTQPAPLQVSTQSTVANGFLNVVVSANGNTVYAGEIDIYLPIGTGEGALSAAAPVATPNTATWTIAKQSQANLTKLPTHIRDLQLEADWIWVQYSALPATSANRLIDFDLQFSFNIQGLDTNSGPFKAMIVESANTDGSTNYNSATIENDLTKSSPIFYVDNFIASSSGTGHDLNVPVGGFPNGEAFILSWQSNGTLFNIYTTEGTAPIYSDSDTQFLVSAGISKDTTFILQAQVTGGPESGTPAPGFETIYLYKALTVTCNNSDLTPKSINNATTIVSTGNISTQANLSASLLTSTGTLNTTGLATLNSAQVTNNLTVANPATNGSLTVYGPTNLQGTAQISAQTSLTGGVTISGGSVNALGFTNLTSGSSTYSQAYTAQTDGVVVGYCPYPANNYSSICVYWIFIVSGSMTAGAVGGNLASTAGGISNPATITLPVKKGESFTVYSTTWQFNQVSVTTTFNFYPVGGGTVSQSANVSSAEYVTRLDNPANEQLINPPGGVVA